MWEIETVSFGFFFFFPSKNEWILCEVIKAEAASRRSQMKHWSRNSREAESFIATETCFRTKQIRILASCLHASCIISTHQTCQQLRSHLVWRRRLQQVEFVPSPCFLKVKPRLWKVTLSGGAGRGGQTRPQKILSN